MRTAQWALVPSAFTGLRVSGSPIPAGFRTKIVLGAVQPNNSPEPSRREAISYAQKIKQNSNTTWRRAVQLNPLGHLRIMQILPHNRRDWLKVVLTPSKAYTVIAPVMFFLSRLWPTNTDKLFLISLYYDSLVLLAAALIIRIMGPRGFALSAAIFGLAGLAITLMLLVIAFPPTKIALFR